MPLPRPLKRSASKRKKRRRIAAVMHDLRHGPHHKNRTHAQEVAIALGNAGESRSKKRKSKRSTKRATSRKRRTRVS